MSESQRYEKSPNFEEIKQKMVKCVDQIDDKLFLVVPSENRIRNILEENNIEHNYLCFCLDNNLNQINSVRTDIGKKEFVQKEYESEIRKIFQEYINFITSENFVNELNSLEIKRDFEGIKEIIKKFGF